MCSCSPLVSFCEVVNGVKQWSVCFVEGGAVQGDLLQPAIFPLLQAGVRATASAMTAFIRDQVGRYNELHRDVLKAEAFDPAGIIRKHLPLPWLSLANDQVVAQKAMRSVQSCQQKLVWESGASKWDVLVKTMSERGGWKWLALTRTLPASELPRAPDAEHAAALRAQLGVLPKRPRRLTLVMGGHQTTQSSSGERGHSTRRLQRSNP